jgi:hypothetical protein
LYFFVRVFVCGERSRTLPFVFINPEYREKGKRQMWGETFSGTFAVFVVQAGF